MEINFTDHSASNPIETPFFERSRSALVHVGFIAVATVLVYSNTLDNAFHMDDFYRIVNNPAIRTIAPVSKYFTDYRTGALAREVAQYRPLLPLSTAINYALHELSTPGYHLLNILFVIIAAWLVYLLVIELITYWPGKQGDPEFVRGAALVTALIFAVHPVSGVTVNYICSRDEMMMTMFLFAAFLNYLRLRRLGGTWMRWGAVIVFHICAMMSKGDAIVAPALVAAFELILVHKPFPIRRIVTGAAAFLVAPLAFFVVTNVFLHFADYRGPIDPDMPWWTYLLKQCYGFLFHYARNFVVPINVLWGSATESAPYPNPLEITLGVLFVLATLCAAYRLRERNPLVTFCIFATWICLAPTSSIIPFYEHFQEYRPLPGSIFVYLALIIIIVGKLERRVLAPIAAAVILYLSISSYIVNQFWETELTFWTRATELGDSYRAHLNLATVIPDKHDSQVDVHMHLAGRLSPNNMFVGMAYGTIMIDRGDTSQGIATCEQAAAWQPTFGNSYYRLALAYAKVHRPDLEEIAITKALHLDPSNEQFQLYATAGSIIKLLKRSLTEYNAGQYEACAATCRAIVALDSSCPQAYNNLCIALTQLGKWDEAIAAGERAVFLQPDMTLARNNLALARRRGSHASQ